MKKISLLILAALISLPSLALAHERWFVNYIPEGTQKPLLFTEWSSTNATFALLGIFALIAALIIHYAIRRMSWVRRMRSWLGRYSTWTPMLLRELTGLLLFFAALSRFLFAPDLQTAGLAAPLERSLLMLELMIGLGLVIGLFPRFMAALGLILYLIALFVFPSANTLVYISFVGIFIYLFIVGDPALPRVRGGTKFFEKLQALTDFTVVKPYAMPLMRIIGGFGFVLAGFLYKIYQPAYALEFLRAHPVNFMHALGFANFSNEVFVLAAGVCEISIGILLIFGLLPRLLGAKLIFLFMLTLGMFGIYELIGHLPFFAFAFALLTHGGGERWSAV